MITFNCYDHNTRLFELLQPFNGMNERLRIDGTFIKQVSCDHDKVNAPFYSVGCDRPERTAKVVETLAHAILFVTQVCIGDVNK